MPEYVIIRKEVFTRYKYRERGYNDYFWSIKMDNYNM